MSLRRPSSAALVAGAAAVAGLLVLASGAGFAEWLFGTALLTFGAIVVRQALAGWRLARAEAHRARVLAAVDPLEVAREAVRAERARLSVDIAARLRELLIAVRDDAASARSASDPGPALAGIHRRAQEAAAELRRQLGLLREPAWPTDADPTPLPEPPRRRDVALAVAVGGVAAIEAVAYPRTAGQATDWSSVALTALTAATALGLRPAPVAAASVAASLYAVGAVVDAPVIGGFWFLVTICGVLWRLAADRSGAGRPAGAAAGLLLVVASTAAGVWRDPENVAVLVVLEVVAVGGGLATRALRRRAEDARRVADVRAGTLAEATTAAVESERGSFAREVHDVVSHAVGVVALQAAAAQVSWPDRPGAVGHNLDVVEETAVATLAELDRLQVGRPAVRVVQDLVALVARIRAGGTPVDLTLHGDLPPAQAGVVYRVVQESLTNVVRHAPGARAVVEVDGSGDRIRVVVADDGPGAARPGRGFGLVGLGERVAFAGGRLTCRPRAGGGFRVEALLPRTTQAPP